MAKDKTEVNDYVFERSVDFLHFDGSHSTGRIDCYKRRCFVLEAKQSPKRRNGKLLPPTASHRQPSGRHKRWGHSYSAAPGWDRLMIQARGQAEDYAHALPVEHGYPPFLLVVDIGKVIEVYADFSGLGKNYAHFPSTSSYRLSMEDLQDPEIQHRLQAIWNDPRSLDPNRHAAAVTRDIAEQLASIARRLEVRYDPEHVAAFLMRCFFTMFAEDIGLIPPKAFHQLLGEIRGNPEHFVPAMEDLWRAMDLGTYSPQLNATLRRFNGSLFKSGKALPLDRDEITELWNAAGRDWSDVEPAIFGTLLERALNPQLRSKLGAHFTPRAYVERLVVPTIIEPLRAEWSITKSLVEDLRAKDDHKGAIDAVRAYHHMLCTIQILDPACGTGNFLYVSLELMKRLEGEVLVALEELGDDQRRFAMAGETVSPHQFFGLEINARAVPIAEMVLWIGFLKWQLKTSGLSAISEPVLHSYGTIRRQDALIAHDTPVVRRDGSGRPVARWDLTMKQHPVTGVAVPDPEASEPVWDYPRATRAEWPEVEFIVGNPPFIAGKDMRRRLGDGYAEACWSVRPHIPGGADLVMHFWDEAAARLLRPSTAARPNPLRRFGFITTNSITQTFSRRVMERHLKAERPLSLVFAVPNHPWVEAADKAAVRIAMTVAEAGDRKGILAETTAEQNLETDSPDVALNRREGKLQARLSLGRGPSQTSPLRANQMIASRGVSLHGAGFLVTPEKARELGLGTVEGLDAHILNYRNGRDLAQRPRGLMVIDLYPMDAGEVVARFPAIYQHVLDTVKPERDSNNMKFRREKWWWFGATHKDLREFLQHLPRYIGTVETSKHRISQFLGADVRPDNKIVAIGLDSAAHLAILSSRVHVIWSIAKGGWMGVGNDPVYAKSETFDPFPFPQMAALSATDTDPMLAQHDRLRELGEQLDQFRKDRQAEHPALTMTGMYNALERLRELENGFDVTPLQPSERAIYQAGLISVLKKLHDDIDRAVLTAYGWEDLIDPLVGKPGATLPCPHNMAAQEDAEQAMLTRLVALNQRRAGEEAQGEVRWLRPDYQSPRLPQKPRSSHPEPHPSPTAAGRGFDRRVTWPADGLEQFRLVRDMLARNSAPAPAAAVWSVLEGRNTTMRKNRVQEVLDLLVATGLARTQDFYGDSGYFIPK